MYVEDLVDNLNLAILNTDENTYVFRTSGTPSALYITAIIHQRAANTLWKVLDSAISDHNPTISGLLNESRAFPAIKVLLEFPQGKLVWFYSGTRGSLY